MVANDMMMSMRVHAFGPPDAIVQESIAIPAPEPDEVLVRVHAAGVGPWDGWIRTGKRVLPQPLPLTLGSDIAGVAARIARAVPGVAPGDAVYGATTARVTGGDAEHASRQAVMLARQPRYLPFVHAASATAAAEPA